MTEKSFGVELREKMVALRVFRPQGTFLGCSPEELEEIRLGQQVDFLPRIYREFMLEMGKGAGGYLFEDGNHLCSSAAEFKQFAEEIIEEYNVKLILPKNAFVFVVLQNDCFYYFYTDSQIDDPPVYQFHFRQDKFIQVDETLSNFLDSLVNWIDEILHGKST